MHYTVFTLLQENSTYEKASGDLYESDGVEEEKKTDWIGDDEIPKYPGYPPEPIPKGLNAGCNSGSFRDKIVIDSDFVCFFFPLEYAVDILSDTQSG